MIIELYTREYAFIFYQLRKCVCSLALHLKNFWGIKYLIEHNSLKFNVNLL